MSNFNFNLLMADMASKTGYKLYRDFGEITDDDVPFRRVNEIVTPVVGIFRLNPVPLTALTTPYIAVVSASIEIPAPTEKAEEVRDKLNEVAGLYNATTNRMDTEDSSFTLVYSFETCVVGDKRRDVGIYNGEIVEISQSVTFTIIERGITALDTELKINGLSVPFLRLEETRVSTSETTPNTEGHGEMAVTQEMYGITFDTPLIDNRLGEMLMDAVNDGAGNKAYAVEIIRNGKSSVYLMGIGTAAASANPPANIGVTISMAEINPMAAKYSDIFRKRILSGTAVAVSYVDAYVFWGDGTSECVSGFTPHVYTDGKDRHTIYYTYGADERYGAIVVGSAILYKTVVPKAAILPSKYNNGTVLVSTSEKDTIVINNGRVSMYVAGNYFPLDEYIESTNTSAGLAKRFTSLLRGTVTSINTDLLEYDRWAVSEEV